MPKTTDSALAEFLFLEKLLNRCPTYIPLLKTMGELYTERGQIEKGLAVDLQLVALIPKDDESWYNLACSYALSGNSSEAITTLYTAIKLGYDSFEWLETDTDLASLHHTPEWSSLIKSIKRV